MEYAADKPGDVKYLLEIARPKIGVVTAVGEIPPHVEFYSGPDAVAREKSKLIEDISVAGFAVLNFDDEAVMDMKERTRAKIMTFGFGEGSDVRISAFENRSENGAPEGFLSNWSTEGVSFRRGWTAFSERRTRTPPPPPPASV